VKNFLFPAANFLFIPPKNTFFTLKKNPFSENSCQNSTNSSKILSIEKKLKNLIKII